MTGSDNNKDDLDWFSTLTSSEPTSRAAEDREAIALRKAIKQRYASELKSLQTPDELALKRLLQRCKQEGLLKPPQRFRFTPPIISGLLAIAAILVLTLTILIQQPLNKLPQDDTVYRGLDNSGAAILSVPHPRKAANALRDELSALGVTALVIQSDEVWLLQAELTLPVAERVAQIIQQQSLPLPADGKLRVKYIKTGSP